MAKKSGATYIMSNKTNSVLYVGSSSELVQRVWQHKHGLVKGFTKKYKVTKLVYYELYDSIQNAIEREQYLKGKKRQYKIELIKKVNPRFQDLYREIV